MKLTKLTLLLLLLLTSTQAMATFCQNDPVNAVDPYGLAAYLVYREFNDPTLSKLYADAGAVGVGHFYLVFDDKDVDKDAWGKLVKELGGQQRGKPIERLANPAYESFSFHPRQVLEEQLGITEHKDSIGGTFYTTSSFVGYNDFNADIRPFLKQRDKGTNKDAAEAKLFKLNITQEQQFALYRQVQDYRTRINVNNENAFGTYKVLVNNCGTWAVSMIEKQGIKVPKGVRKLNVFGAGVGGVQDYLPLTYTITGGAAVYGYGKIGVQSTASAGKTAVIATGQGLYWTGSKAVDLIESTGGEFYVAPYEDERGGASAGIRWTF